MAEGCMCSHLRRAVIIGVTLANWAGLSGAVSFVIITHMFSEMHPMSNINHDASVGTVGTNTMTSMSDKRGRSRACFGLRWAVQARKLSVPASICTVMKVEGKITFEYVRGMTENEKYTNN